MINLLKHLLKNSTQLEALVKQFNSVKVGNSLDPNSMMGAQVNAKQLKKILDYVKIGESEGCKVACGGVQVTENGLDKGCYMRPTLLINANNKMRVAQEEIFGPVAVVILLLLNSILSMKLLQWQMILFMV